MTRRKLILLLLLITLLATTAGSADAQFWKKKSKRHHSGQTEDQNRAQADSTQAPQSRHQRKTERKKEKKERKRLKHERKENKKIAAQEKKHPHPKVPKPVVIKKQEIKYPETQLKPRYRVDVLAQLYLDDFSKNGTTTYSDRIPDKALPGISFYEGLNIAADSLKKAGYNFDIYVHDVASAKESAEMLVKNGMLDTADLILGAVPAQDIPIVAEYAKKRQINFISALSASDGAVRNNEYFTMVQPSLKTQCQWIAADIAKKFPGMQVALLYRVSAPVDESAYNYLINDTSLKLSFKRMLCNTLPGKDSLASLLDTAKPNVVVIPVVDPLYADSLLKRLSRSFPAAHFEVYGMPSWNSISNLRKEGMYPNLSVNVTTPFNIDQSVGLGRYVARTYKNDYGGKAPEIVFRGFEAMFWYANLLKHYGTIFNTRYDDNAAAPFTRFEIAPQWDKDGSFLFNENKHVFLTRYEGGFYRIE